ncbi:MAG: isocitrate lyase/phosphoenolpyruvate mutase family protein [Alphaproteobacteria bacterium]|nr:isocitrate lyase/phosphoenolpyruvate mutase family protein [Alphaproteobacteria bacterium]
MVETSEDKGHRFRDLHESGCFVLPNAWDAGSARLLEQLGFGAIGTTSAGFSWSAGLKDGAASRDAVLANAATIAEATSLPVSADLLNGFGHSPETVAETIRLAGELGLSGGSIEDTTGDPARPLFELALAVERIEAAVDAARKLPQPFVLCARADGLFAGLKDFDDVILRLQAYEKAGADLLYAPALMTLGQVRDVLAAVATPVNVLCGIGNEGSVEELSGLGVRRISLGSTLYRAAMGQMMQRAANALHEEGAFDGLAGGLTPGELNELMRGD